MRCPACSHIGTKVLDSRPAEDGRATRRRRECESCQQRFTTFERIEESPIVVVKRDGTREEFSRKKILRGLLRACEKRPVALEQLEEVTLKVAQDIRTQGHTEVKSEYIGELVMSHLAQVDDVAYVRFASVYRQFNDLNAFIEELKRLMN